MDESLVSLDEAIAGLDTIHVPSLVAFLVNSHPEDCPIDLANRTLDTLDSAPYSLDFGGEHKFSICSKCSDTSCSFRPK